MKPDSVSLRLRLQRLLRRLKIRVGSSLQVGLKLLNRSGLGPSRRVCSATEQQMVEVERLRDPVQIPRCSPRYVPDHPDSASYLSHYLQVGTQTLPCCLLTLSCARISMPISLHRWRGRVFREALICERVLANPKYAFDLELMPFRRSRTLDEGVLLSLPWYHNYYHWLVEILPRLQFAPCDVPLLVPRTLPDFCLRTLDELGLLERVKTLENGIYEVSKLYIPSVLSTKFNVSPLAVAWLREKFLPATRQSPRRLIYVSRNDALTRFLENEPEAVCALQELGFENVNMDSMGTLEQARLFSEAKLVVGSHGAAFANLVFGSPGATVIEIFERGHFAHCYSSIAAQVGMHYGFLIGEPCRLGFTVDIPSMKAMVLRALTDMNSD